MSGSVRVRKPADGVLFDEILGAILHDARQGGEIAADVDTAELGAILGGMIMEALQRWASGRTGSHSLRESLELRVDLVLHGVRR
jgi:hypothetical protein